MTENEINITDMIKALQCIASQDADVDCYCDHFNAHLTCEQFGDNTRLDEKHMSCGGVLKDTQSCPYSQNTYGVCYEDGELWWLKDIVSVLTEIQQYRAIGTIEEIKDLKEKSVAKKPKYQKIQYGKHKWKRKENGEIDDFAWDYAYCNGVVCEVCGETQCVHCNPKYDKLKNCEVEDYFCPTCNEAVGYFYSHCKHCWQKLDWE